MYPTRRLADVASAPIIYGILQPGPEVADGVPYIRPTEIQRHQILLDEVRRTSAAIAKRYERSTLATGDVLLSIVGTIGKTAIVPPTLAGANITQSSVRIRVDPTLMIPEFLQAVLQSPDVLAQFDTMRLGTAVPRVNVAQVRDLEVPAPPIDVQRRIVAKLDELLAQSRAAREQLEAVPALVEQYRQSVLAAAFRGDLTADWRKKHPDVEPASKLLERIRIERRAKWEAAELAKLKAKGKTSKDDNWKSKYVEPEPVDSTELPELPPTWCWASMDEIVADAKIGLVRSAAQQGSDGVPYLRMQHFDQHGRWFLDDVTSVSVDEHELEEFRLREGDVLFNTRNSVELVGKSALWSNQERAAVFNNNLMRLRASSAVTAAWLAKQLIAPSFRARIAKSISATTSVAAIYGRDLFRQAVAVAPLDEQRVVDALIAQLFWNSDSVASASMASIHQNAILERSLLAKAFRGEFDV